MDYPANNPVIRAKVFGAAVVAMRKRGMSNAQIMQWAYDNCPCKKCVNRREKEHAEDTAKQEG